MTLMMGSSPLYGYYALQPGACNWADFSQGALAPLTTQRGAQAA